MRNTERESSEESSDKDKVHSVDCGEDDYDFDWPFSFENS